MDKIEERDPEAVEPEPIGEVEDGRADWQVVLQFFVIPLVVIAIAAGIFFLFGMLTQDSLTASDYLSQVRTGSKARRYQAATRQQDVFDFIAYLCKAAEHNDS